MTRTRLDRIECHLDDQLGLHFMQPPLDPPHALQKPRRQLGNLLVGQSGIRLADRQERPTFLVAHGKRVITQHLAPPAVPVFHPGHHHIERGEFLLQLHPSQPAPPRRVSALRILAHQSLVPPRPRRAELLLDRRRALHTRHRRHGQRFDQQQPFQHRPPRAPRQLQQRVAVPPQHIEGHEFHRHVFGQKQIRLAPVQPLLQIEKRQPPPRQRGEDFPVEYHRPRQSRRRLRDFRELRGDPPQVARENLAAPVRHLHLRADTVVFVLHPHRPVRSGQPRPHRLAVRFRPGQHALDRMKHPQSDAIQGPFLGRHRQGPHVTEQHPGGPHLARLHPERFDDRLLEQSFLQPDPQVARQNPHHIRRLDRAANPQKFLEDRLLFHRTPRRRQLVEQLLHRRQIPLRLRRTPGHHLARRQPRIIAAPRNGPHLVLPQPRRRAKGPPQDRPAGLRAAPVGRTERLPRQPRGRATQVVIVQRPQVFRQHRPLGQPPRGRRHRFGHRAKPAER